MSGEKNDGSAPPPYSEVGGYPSQTQSYPMQGPPQHYPPQQYPPQQQQYGYDQYPSHQQGYPQAYVGTNVVIAQPTIGMATQAAPPDQMGAAIFVTLCCFWPTGIFAIMKASEAKNAAARGDMMTANTQARSARQFINISIGLGIASIIIAGVIIGIYVGVLANFNHNYYDD